MGEIELGLVAACPNHANRPGTVRCDACLRKVCEECLIHEGSNKYCSAKCVEGAKATRARVEDLNSRPPPASGNGIPVGTIVVLGLLIAGAWYAWQHKQAIIQLVQRYLG
ncbi:MAG: hypothetical protein FJX76_05590 [Armatimonadetes bacterium]|nr:hypothetical protein [Armatimonadota bacterium]